MLPRKFFLLLIFSIILTLGLSISLGSLLAAWTAPASSPPEGNIAAPINTSNAGQAKQGGLIINTGDSVNGLIVQYGNVGIGTTDPRAKLEVDGNIIASAPTASDHLATKGYVDASGGGGCFDQYHYPWCTTHPGEKCARVGTMDYKCVGDFCTKAGISNDMDGDGVSGATDCNDNDPTIVAATDGTCDGDADGKIDQTAYLATPKLAAADCYDSNPAKYSCLSNGTVCSSGIYCASGYCIDGVCCNNTCEATCAACNMAGSIGTCANIPNDSDPFNECAAITCSNYVYGGTSPSCYKYASATSHNGMCNGAGACYTPVSDSCSGQGSATITCGSTGCWKACVANSPSTSYDAYNEVCYTDFLQRNCSSGYFCNASGGCSLKPNGISCSSASECNSNYCVNGVCCNSACSGNVCQRCDSYSSAGAGTCGNVITDSQVTGCNGSNFCNGAGACLSCSWTYVTGWHSSYCVTGSTFYCRPSTVNRQGYYAPPPYSIPSVTNYIWSGEYWNNVDCPASEYTTIKLQCVCSAI
ncbi:MAG: hypothetical protein WC619_01200 [Patescibacteria group bacterium]